jgi:hypothetical protein
LGEIGDGIRGFGYSDIVVKVLAYRDPLDLLGLLANKVGTTLYTSLDIIVKHSIIGWNIPEE